ncbi:MAG: ADOP family duplicated permease [Vicinamibacterales bacterium]
MTNDDDIRRELEFHLERQASAYRAQGVPPLEAERRARLDLGGVSQVADDCRRLRRWVLLEQIGEDARLAVRLAMRTPAFTAMIVLALTVGIGAASTIMAVVNGVLLKPLPYRQPDELVMVWSRAPQGGESENTLSPADVLDLKQRAQTLEAIEGYFSFLSPLEVVLDGRTEIAYGQAVTRGLFELLGRRPVRGRTFAVEGGEPEAVLSFGYWTRRFGGDPNVVGRSIRIGTLMATIVGVMPKDFAFPYPGMLGPSGYTRATGVDMWVTMAFGGPAAADQRTVDGQGVVLRGVRFLGAIGRRKPGVTHAQVQGDMTRVARELETEHPSTHRGWGATVRTAKDQTVGRIRPALLLLFGGVGLVLLAATVNVTNLMLSRALDRHAEYATRLAVGASRGRLLRQSIVESLLLTGIGAGLGLGLGTVGTHVLVGLAPPDIPRLADIGTDWRVAATTLLIVLVVGALIGVLPAIGLGLTHSPEAQRDRARGSSGTRTQRRRQTTLMAVQVALAVVLTLSAGLLLRSFISVLDVDAGFNADQLLTWQMNLPDRLKTPDERRAFYRELFDRLAQLPGVVAVGGTTRLPLGSTSVTTRLEIQGRPVPEVERPEVEFRRALHRYFEAMQIPIRRGHGFDANAGPESPPVAIVNETLAGRLFAGEEVLGRRIRTGPSSPWMEIVGVIGDVRHVGLEQAPAPELYVSYLQNPPVAPFLVMRTTGDPAALMDVVRLQARQLDPDLPLYDMRTMADVRSAAVAERRFILWVVGLFGIIALMLAAVGIDGLMAVWVHDRMLEMSVRLALGAEPHRLWRMVVLQSARVTAVGLAGGLLLTWLATPFLRGQLYGVGPADPGIIVGTVVLFLLVATTAALIPARRAAHAEPGHALRAG